MKINEMVLALDRISRFKYPEIKLKRVYVEALCEYLKREKIKKSELEKFDNKSLKVLFESLWNLSIKENFDVLSDDFSSNKNFIEQEKRCYNLNKSQIDLFPLKADFSTLIKKTKKNPNNFLKYKTPKKVILTEGITEEVLLPEFAKMHGYSFDDNCIKILGTGGKNQIQKQYQLLKKQLKIPIFILLDFDAKSVFEQIKKDLRKIDYIHLIKNGEIEDIIPKQIFKKAINTEFNLQEKVSINDFDDNISMVENLENIFKTKNFGEFKKAKMAQYVKRILNDKLPISEELMAIIDEIKSF